MMGNTMETGLLAEWVVEEGATVEEDDVLAVVESEKAAADVVATQAGTLARVDVEEGEEVPPGTLVGVVLGDDESLDDAPAPRSRKEAEAVDAEQSASEGEEASGASGGGPATEGTGPETGDETAAVDEGEGASGGDEVATDDERVRAAPGARKLAADHGVDLTELGGTGPEGAVLIADVEGALDGASDTSEAAERADDRPATATGRSFTSPTTRRLARELGVSLADVEGTGIGGRVTESDVRAAAGRASRAESAATGTEAGATDATTNDADALGVTVEEERSLSRVRQTIAHRMARSAREAPHVTLNREVSVERAFRAASELSAAGDAVGFTDVLVAAAARTLDGHPEFNAWFEDERLRLVSEKNVAVAVDAEAGLVTPVVREAGRRSLAGIAAERRRLTEEVLDGTFSMEALRGGTFTISNLGMFGVDSFDPIINPPQVAILGVGRVREGDERTCTLSLSFDHRVVDGADAARFLDTLTGYVEAPTPLVAGRPSGESRSGAPGEGTPAGETRSTDERAGGTTGREGDGREASLADLVGRDLRERAEEVAAAHDWPVPTFDVTVAEGRPSVRVRPAEGLSAANAKRLVYAACRESAYADAVVGLRDPTVSVE